MIFNNFQPLSNILISKRICPSNNPESPVIKKKFQLDKQHARESNNQIKKESLKKILPFDDNDTEKQ